MDLFPFFRRRLTKEPAVITPELRREIRRSFDESAADDEHFPVSIDPRIRHVQVVLKHLGPIDDKRLLDAGCGKGRYGRVIVESNPNARVVAMDLSERMLRFAPGALRRVSGSLTELPFADASFDGVFAVESIEHAVDIESTVRELCRVLRPGGKLAIIDKSIEHWGRLETPAWEKWFDRREMESLIRRHCRNVRSEPISYWDDVKPDGLFLVWLAVK